MKYYVFDHIRGASPNFSLVVLAVSEQDARKYVKKNHGGGRLIQAVEAEKVDARYGAITQAASLELGKVYDEGH